jgi:hypothetical protein
VDVRFDETGRHQPAADVDRLASRAGGGVDADDPLAGDRDVHEAVPVRQAGSA